MKGKCMGLIAHISRKAKRSEEKCFTHGGSVRLPLSLPLSLFLPFTLLLGLPPGLFHGLLPFSGQLGR